MEIFKSNSKRREILLPLFNWRYLGLVEIKQASGYVKSIEGLRRMLLRLENDGLVESFIHRYANRKFYCLTKKTFNNYSDDPWYLNSETKDHDAIVSSFLFQIKDQDFVEKADLNFPVGFYEIKPEYRVVEPDGYFTGRRYDGKRGVFALEIELNRKNSSVIESKLEGYYRATHIDFALYVFNDLSILKAYFRYNQEFLSENRIPKEKSKILFCLTDHLGEKDFDFCNMVRVTSNGEFSKFGSLFYAN